MGMGGSGIVRDELVCEEAVCLIVDLSHQRSRCSEHPAGLAKVEKSHKLGAKLEESGHLVASRLDCENPTEKTCVIKI